MITHGASLSPIPSPSLSILLGGLDGVKKVGAGWKARCPAHHDRNPSLSISEKGGRVLVHCLAGCQQDDVLDALRGMRLWPERAERSTSTYPMPRPTPRSTPTRATSSPAPAKATKSAKAEIAWREDGPPIDYPYTDKDGTILAFHRRRGSVGVDPTTGELVRDKRVSWVAPDGSLGLDGLKMADLPLYQQREVLAAPADAWIMLCEGEPAADAARSRGFVATSLSGGASQTDFGTALEALHGRKVALWPDNDEPGHKLMQRVEKALTGKVKRLKTLDVPFMPAKGDAADFVAAGRTPDELRAILNQPRAASRLLTAEALLAREYGPLVSVVDKLLLAGSSYLFCARSKDGKTIASLQLALGIATGTAALGTLKTKQADTLYLMLEDGERRTQSRIREMLATSEHAKVPDRLTFAFTWPRIDEGGLDDLREWGEAHPGGVIIVDILERIRPRRGMNVYEADYTALSGLTDLAHELGITIIIISHNNKVRGADIDPLDMISGTMGLPGAVDGALVFRPRQHGAREAHLCLTHRDTGRAEYILTWDEYLAGWRFDGEATGDGAPPARSPEREAILVELRRAVVDGGPGLLPVELAARVGKSRESVRYLLHKMRGAREVAVDDAGRYVATDRAASATGYQTPAATSSVVPANSPNTPNRPNTANGLTGSDAPGVVVSTELLAPVSDPVRGAPNRQTAAVPGENQAAAAPVRAVSGVSDDSVPSTDDEQVLPDGDPLEDECIACGAPVDCYGPAGEPLCPEHAAVLLPELGEAAP